MHTYQYFYFTYHIIFCLYISLQQNAKLPENKSLTLFYFESPVSNRYLAHGRNMGNNLWGISVLYISISTAQGTGHLHRTAWHKLHRLASSENRVPSTDSHSTSKAQLSSKSPLSDCPRCTCSSRICCQTYHQQYYLPFSHPSKNLPCFFNLISGSKTIMRYLLYYKYHIYYLAILLSFLWPSLLRRPLFYPLLRHSTSYVEFLLQKAIFHSL